MQNTDPLNRNINRLKELIPNKARVGFYPSSGTNIHVFDFTPLPLDFVICSDYHVKEYNNNKIITVQADNNLCLRYIIEAGIKLSAIFAIQDGAVEGGNYEFVNSAGFLGRLLPALNKTFILVNNPNNQSYTSFDKGPVKRVKGDVSAYRDGHYSAYAHDTSDYHIIRYKKDYHASTNLGLEIDYEIDESRYVKQRAAKLLKTWYKTIWEDQKWLDGIFVRKNTLDGKQEKTSLKKYWPANYLANKVFDITPLTKQGSVIPLLEFANSKKLKKVGLVALTNEKGKFHPHYKHFKQNIEEYLYWPKEYPQEIHLYFIDKNSYQFALSSLNDFSSAPELALKGIDDDYLTLLSSYYQELSRRVSDARINRMVHAFISPLIDSSLFAKEPNEEGQNKHDKSKLSLIRKYLSKEDFENAIASSKYLVVKDKNYQLPPHCIYISRSGRYSAHRVDHLRQDQGYVLWDNLRKIVLPDLFHDLAGVDEENGWVFCRSMNGFHQSIKPFWPLRVNLDFIELIEFWDTVYTVPVKSKLNTIISVEGFLEMRRKHNNCFIGHNPFDLANHFELPDYSELRKSTIKQLLYNSFSDKEGIALIAKIKNHPLHSFWRYESDMNGLFEIMEILAEKMNIAPGIVFKLEETNGKATNKDEMEFLHQVNQLLRILKEWEKKYEKTIEVEDDLPF